VSENVSERKKPRPQKMKNPL